MSKTKKTLPDYIAEMDKLFLTIVKAEEVIKKTKGTLDKKRPKVKELAKKAIEDKASEFVGKCYRQDIDQEDTKVSTVFHFLSIEKKDLDSTLLMNSIRTVFDVKEDKTIVTTVSMTDIGLNRDRLRSIPPAQLETMDKAICIKDFGEPVEITKDDFNVFGENVIADPKTSSYGKSPLLPI